MTDHEAIIRRLDHFEGCLLGIVRDSLALSRECVALLAKPETDPAKLAALAQQLHTSKAAIDAAVSANPIPPT